MGPRISFNKITNVLTKFNEEVITRINSTTLEAMLFNRPELFFELIQDIINKNVPMLTNSYYRHIKKMDRPLASRFFQPTGTIFERVQYIITINGTSRVLTRTYTIKCPAPLRPCIFYQPTNLLTKFHEDWTLNVTLREKCPASKRQCFQPTKTIFELFQDIIGKNLLTKFHEDRTINVANIEKTRLLVAMFSTYYRYIMKNAPPLVGHIFQPTKIVFELVQDIIGKNPLTKLNEVQTINVASRVHIKTNTPPPGGHIFQTHLLTKFHKNLTINVASRVLTRQMFTTHDGRRTKGDQKSSP
ncbi:hypothetical protein DPMN_058218 [Dreissena polymorpha]|uniref:Uncharacterized protein n=1 Tax=Dreissena polymorpha TaxID=45954 RepID=A0A9D4C1P4_DREPO|nr:hypothetical protein DPMN_058218 [Dreissena polymorpha]